MKNTNLIIGKTHTGKTQLLFESVDKAINNNESIVIFDEKEEYYKTYKETLEGKNYNTYVLNLNDTTKSNGFNPLYLPYQYYKNGNIDKAIEVIQDFAHEIFFNEGNADPFWENSASDYVTGLCLILFKEAKEEEINLGSIQTLMTLGETKFNDTSAIKEYMKNISVLDPIYMYISQTIMAPAETKGSILSVVKQELNSYCAKPNLLNVLCDNEIKINEISDKTAIFVIGNSKIANILIDEIVNEKLSFNYILDNFDNNIKTLTSLIKNIDYYNSKLFVAVRDVKDITDKYKNIQERFENVVELKDEKEAKIIDKNVVLPEHKLKEIKYFNLIEFLK